MVPEAQGRRETVSGTFFLQKKMLSPWPTPEPPNYVRWLNGSQGREEIGKIRDAIRRSRPYGSHTWESNAIGKFGLKITMRNPVPEKRFLTPLFSPLFSPPGHASARFSK
jgi:hypothetical protein